LETKESEWTEATEEEQELERKETAASEAKPGQVVLRPQMLQVMKAMSEYGYLTMAEIQFIYGNKTWSYRHMKLLREQGIISDFDTLMSPRTAHYLTPRGYRVLGKTGQLKTGWRFRPERYSTFGFRHRMACAKAGLLLERHPLVSDFLPEIRLWKYQKREAEKVCDGEFWYRVPGRELMDRVGLEVELTLKNRDRQDEAFRQFSRRKLAQVWWLCGDETTVRALRRQVLDRRHQLGGQRHYFALLEEFLAARGMAELMDAEGALFSIDPDKPTLPTREPERPPEPSPLPPKPAVCETQATADAVSAPKAEPPCEPVASSPAARPSALARDTALFRSEASKLWNWAWPWIRDSWSLSGGYDGPRRLRFHRWPHVSALICIAAIFMLPGMWSEVQRRATYRPAAPPRAARQAAKTPAPVYEYALEEVWVSSNGFSVQSVRLLSSGGKHQLGYSICSNADDADISAVSLRDSKGRTRAVIAKRPWVLAQRCAPSSVLFGGTLDPDGFTLAVEAKRWKEPGALGRLEVPIKLKR
jgi:hypothetical protein